MPPGQQRSHQLQQQDSCKLFTVERVVQHIENQKRVKSTVNNKRHFFHSDNGMSRSRFYLSMNNSSSNNNVKDHPSITSPNLSGTNFYQYNQNHQN